MKAGARELETWKVHLIMLMRNIPLFRWLFFLLAALPAIYMVLVIQYGAITVPWADDAEFVQLLASWYDGNFQLHSLWAPHAQARPLLYRIVFGCNAIMTDWDVRSEYIYIYLAFYGTFACHAWGLHKVTRNGGQNSLIFPVALAIASLVVFSPVAHNDQWWSFMFVLDGGSLFISISFLTAFLRPSSVGAQIAAAIACWVASYTITNGIFAMITICFVFHLTSERFTRPSRWALFWWANLAILLVCYIPGIRLSGAAAPTALQILEFSLAFLGLPLGGLLWFPYHNMFDLPLPIMTNALCGAFLLASASLLCWDARSGLREQRSAAVILFGFTIFAIISAIATGWGRANNDQFTVSNGNSSRYAIFAAYLVLGQLYYVAHCLAHRYKSNTYLQRITALGAVIFIALAAVSYDKAITIYRNVHEFNQEITSAFTWGLQPNPYDKFVFPGPSAVTFKSDLERLELGPYNDRQYDTQVLPTASLQKLVLLSDESNISQTFKATRNGLKDVFVTMFKPNGRRTSGIIQWYLTQTDNTQILASGTLNAARIHEYENIRLKLPYLGDSNGRDYRVTLSGSANSMHSIAVALYAPVAGSKPNVSITGPNNKSEIENLSMALILNYAD